MRTGRHDSVRRKLLTGATSVALAAFAPGRARADEPALRRVADGIYVREGLDQDADAKNDDAIANLALIVGEHSAAVIDPGGSVADGLRFKAAIRHITPLPLRYVVFTHAHPDHLFGATAFENEGATFVAHHAFPQALADRGDYYTRSLTTILGRPPGDLVRPQYLVDHHDELDLGNRRLRLSAHPAAHSNCDLSIFDVPSKTLMAGDLLFARRVPSLDGSLKGWIDTLTQLKGLEATRAVPGHGPAALAWPRGAGALERYLRVLQSDTRNAIAQGLEIDAATRTVGQSERGRWRLFDAYHGHNVTRAYKEIEWE